MKTIFWNILGIMTVFMLFQATVYSQDGITGTVFLDEDSDGIYDSDENPVPNVIVLLQDQNSNLLASAITGADGAYIFENLPEIIGDFFVSISLPNGTFCTTSIFQVVQYQDGESVEIDFGLNYLDEFPSGLIVGLVWYDSNYNGVYDDGEEGFETEIILKNEDGFYIEAVMSNSETGAFIFDNVVDGNYIVEAEAIPTGSILISPQQQEVTMENGEASANVYFGFQPIESSNIDLRISAHAASNTILDYEFDYTLSVRNDGNDLATGIQVKSVLPDELEFVEFITLDGTYDWDTGIWTCDDVEAGQFGSSYFIMRVKAVAEGNLEWKTEIIAADQFDPDSTPNNMGESPVEDDESIVEIYSTEYGSVGDMVWLDENGDGIQDSNEPGIPGITMYLYDENGDVVATTVTDADGTYLFDELVDGMYTVVVGDGPEGTVLTTLSSYTVTILFIEVVHSEYADFGFKMVDDTEVIDLEVGINELEETVEVGELESYKVFVGNTGSGNASGLEIAVTLPDNLSYVNAYSVSGGYNPTTGIWSMGSLVAGDYVELTVLVEGMQEGNAEIIVEVVSANETDVDSTPDNLGDAPVEDDEGMAYILVLPDNEGSIGDTVFEDADGDGIQSPGEDGIENVTVYLQDDNGDIIATTITANGGTYLFDNLADGNYVVFVGNTLGSINIYESFNVTITNGSDYLDADFSITIIEDSGEGSITGQVETTTGTVSGAIVFLYNTDGGLLGITYSDDLGEYDFEDLIEGTYVVTCTYEDNVVTPLYYEIELGDGENLSGIDFWIGTNNVLVWPGDANNDGIANNLDLLNVGLAFDQMGIPRDSISTEWIGQTCDNWAFYFENEVNLKHADCDGSGFVNNSDVEAINLNYGLVHGKIDDENEANEDDPLLALDFPDDAFQSGDTLEIPIRLGDMDNVLDALYGIAFSIEFEEGLFVEESIEIDFMDSWLGIENDNLLTLDKLIDGQVIDIALSRNNQMDVSGGGQLAVMRGIIDDIAGKEDFLEFDFVLKNVKAIMADETEIPIFYEDTSIAVGNDGTGTDNIDFGANTHLYPNPATDIFNIEFEAEHLPKSVAFYAVDGRAIKTITNVNSDLSINVATWRSGVYFVEMVFESGSIWHKVVVE